LPATLGTALGALVVTFLLDASWPVRIGVVALVIVLALAAGRVALVRRERKEAAAGAPDPATAGGQVGDEASSAAYGTNPTDTQGDTTDD
jgi:membrane protein implicated in regulation of membrane protease activity